MKRHPTWSVFAGAFAAGAALFHSTAALAQPSGDPLVARQLFKEARALAAAGHYDQACPKFEESLKQEEGIGTLFNLADCWEKIGRSASAWARFLDAATMARHAGQADREKVARERASQLEAHLSRLTVDVQSTATGLVVTRNGTATIEKAAWGSAVPVDPGAYSIEAKAPGRKPWKGSVTVAAGAGNVRIMVPELAVESASASPPAAAMGTEPASLGDVQRPEATRDGSTQRTAALVVGGVGVIGVAGGIVFGLKAKSKADGLADICPAGAACSQGDIDAYASQRDQSVTARTLSVVGFAVGGAALAAGAVLFFTAPDNSATKSNQIGVWTDGRGSAGLRLGGAW